tara:strand:- start:116 stop:1342 length:1227 start_codon:yes stop_codon:yes gene_type:complete
MTGKEIFSIPTANKFALERKIEKLAKRAEKLGCDLPTMEIVSETYSKTYVVDEYGNLDHHHDNNCGCQPTTHQKFLKLRNIEFVDVKVLGQGPSLKGWSITVYVTRDGMEFGGHANASDDERARVENGECDHCGLKRNRKGAFIVEHLDGSHKVIGTTCIKDFLGWDSPNKIASYMTSLHTFINDADFETTHSIYGQAVETFDLDTVLELAHREVETNGWVSVGMANDWTTSYTDEDTTKQKVLIGLKNTSKATLSPEAQVVKDWMLTLKGSDTDYLNNLGIIAEKGFATSRTIGIAVSGVIAYQNMINTKAREEARKEQVDTSVHMGEIGKREVFDNVVLTEVKYIESQFGVSVLHKFNMNGNQIVWFGSKKLEANEGEIIRVKATVKKHDTFNGIAQTIVNRVALA